MPRASRTRAWVVAAVALAVVAAVLLSSGRAVSGPDLPEVTPEELLASMATALAGDPSISGQASARFDLSLPELPGTGSPLGDLAGEKSLRVWRSADGARLAEVGETWERSITRGAEDLWIWDSRTMTVTHLTAPAHRDPEPQAPGDPLAMAREALAALDESTEVAVGTNGRVAGRDAYTLVLLPRTDRTLVERVEISVDAGERLPLRVAVFARDAAAPAIEGAYTSVSFDPVDPALFEFRPPPGATLEEWSSGGDRPSGSQSSSPRKLGDGWATVLAVPWSGERSAAAELLPFSGPLLSARLVDGPGGRWLVLGAVPQEVLIEEASTLR